MELRLEIEEGLLHLVLALQVDEKHVDQSPALLLVLAPALLLLEFERESLDGEGPTWRCVAVWWACVLR